MHGTGNAFLFQVVESDEGLKNIDGLCVVECVGVSFQMPSLQISCYRKVSTFMRILADIGDPEKKFMNHVEKEVAFGSV